MRANEFTEPQAAGCILYAEDTGRWGLQQRSDTVSDPGVWSTWGGGREPGESLEQTVRRELEEESGYSGPITLELLARNVRYVTYIGIVPKEFEPRPCDEWKDFCWVELGRWPSPLHPGVASALENIYIKENFADGGNPVKFTVTSPDRYKHSFQITLAVHGKHVGHFNFVRSADTDDVNNEAEVESRWQGQGYGKLLLMKAIDVANNHGLDFQQDIRGITDAQQNVYDSLENAGLIVTPGDGFWFLTPQGEQELNGLNENFADGKVKGKSRPGRVKRSGASCSGSVTDLRARAKKYGGERGRMYHWCANMKSGRNK